MSLLPMAETNPRHLKESNRRLRILTVAAVAGLAVAGVLAAAWTLYPAASEYSRFTSPDGRYAVVVHRIPSLFSMMPGHGGDARGFVRLVDGDGRILQEKPVAMVNTISYVEWKPELVHIGLFADWRLPPPPSSGH